jgi:hypothetical protein
MAVTAQDTLLLASSWDTLKEQLCHHKSSRIMRPKEKTRHQLSMEQHVLLALQILLG